jgi:hypothetical protein
MARFKDECGRNGKARVTIEDDHAVAAEFSGTFVAVAASGSARK